MTIDKKDFGKTKNGENVELYILKDGGVTAEIITYGAAIRSLTVPVGSGGKVRDVALGFDTITDYEANECFHGAVIGRVGNRIAKGTFTLNGKTYHCDLNDKTNNLHGGFAGFDKQVWNAEAKSDALILTLTDREGTTAGFPGDMTATVTYTLKGGELGIDYTATCTEDCPVNLTQHCYFNLAGHGSGSIVSHKLQIMADKMTPVDDTIIPTGELRDVAGTPFDFRQPRLIGDGIEADDEQIKLGGGYDHNWVLSSEPYRTPPAPAAVLECDGLRMEVLTTKPGIQFYAGNMMCSEVGKEGAVYSPRTGLCLETQYWPNAVNTPSFPAPILRAGETYKHKTIFKFTS